MNKPEKPKSQIEEVLYYLLTRLKIDRRQMMLTCGVLNLPEAIRKLRETYGVKITLNEVYSFNKFGRQIKYGEYSLDNKKDAAATYKNIQKTAIYRPINKTAIE